MGFKTGSGLLFGIVAMLALGGCEGQPRFKGLESYANATTTNEYGKLPPFDPYSYGGTAYASGGLAPAASYGTGAPGQYDGDPEHYLEIVDRDGENAPPVDWGNGASNTSGIIVPETMRPIEEAESGR